jgi:hypothetical protein
MKLRNSNLPAAEGQPVANKARLTAQHLHQHWHCKRSIFSGRAGLNFLSSFREERKKSS